MRLRLSAKIFNKKSVLLGQEESKTVILIMSPPMTLRNLAQGLILQRALSGSQVVLRAIILH